MNLESIRMALRGIVANRMRSALTMLGILIGVGAVIILVAVGAGSAATTRKSLEALGSNTLTVSAPAGFGQGNRGGTQSRNLQITDADVVGAGDKTAGARHQPQWCRSSTAAQRHRSRTTARRRPWASSSAPATAYSDVRNAPVQAGTFFTADDVTNHANVVVIGTTVAKNLLGATGDPNSLIGQPVQFGSHSLTVIGVLKPKGSNGFQDQDDIAIVPYTTVRDNYTGNTGTFSQLIVQATGAKATGPGPGRDHHHPASPAQGRDRQQLPGAEPGLAAADRQRQQPDVHRAARFGGGDLAARRRHRRDEHHARHRHRAHP